MTLAIHTISTPRLTVRRFTTEDIENVSLLLDLCFGPEPRTQREEWLTWQVASYRVLESLYQTPYGDYALVDQGGVLVGSVGLVKSAGPFESLHTFSTAPVAPKDALHSPEMGLFWAVHPEYRRRGYALEGAQALARWVFEHLKARRLVATTEHNNTGSIAVMKSLGMRIVEAPEGSPPWFQTIGVLSHPSRL